jgi:hypothetical protein
MADGVEWLGEFLGCVSEGKGFLGEEREIITTG